MSAFTNFFSNEAGWYSYIVTVVGASFVIWRSIALHGIQKWTNFESMSAAFPDPTGSWTFGFSKAWPFLGSFLFDWLYSRCALSVGNDPDDFYHGVAFFVIHGNDPFFFERVGVRLLGRFYLDVYSRTMASSR